MGLGLLGRGVGDAEFLAPLVKELLVTDKKTKEELGQKNKDRSWMKNLLADTLS